MPNFNSVWIVSTAYPNPCGKKEPMLCCMFVGATSNDAAMLRATSPQFGQPCAGRMWNELALEFAMPEAGKMEVLATLPASLRLGFGCVDVRCPEIESPETIVARVRNALQLIPASRLSLNPDCGFAPSGNNPIPLDEPYAKLKALGSAAAILRMEISAKGSEMVGHS